MRARVCHTSRIAKHFHPQLSLKWLQLRDFIVTFHRSRAVYYLMWIWSPLISRSSVVHEVMYRGSTSYGGYLFIRLIPERSLHNRMHTHSRAIGSIPSLIVTKEQWLENFFFRNRKRLGQMSRRSLPLEPTTADGRRSCFRQGKDSPAHNAAKMNLILWISQLLPCKKLKILGKLLTQAELERRLGLQEDLRTPIPYSQSRQNVRTNPRIRPAIPSAPLPPTQEAVRLNPFSPTSYPSCLPLLQTRPRNSTAFTSIRRQIPSISPTTSRNSSQCPRLKCGRGLRGIPRLQSQSAAGIRTCEIDGGRGREGGGR